MRHSILRICSALCVLLAMSLLIYFTVHFLYNRESLNREFASHCINGAGPFTDKCTVVVQQLAKTQGLMFDDMCANKQNNDNPFRIITLNSLMLDLKPDDVGKQDRLQTIKNSYHDAERILISSFSSSYLDDAARKYALKTISNYDIAGNDFLETVSTVDRSLVMRLYAIRLLLEPRKIDGVVLAPSESIKRKAANNLVYITCHLSEFMSDPNYYTAWLITGKCRRKDVYADVLDLAYKVKGTADIDITPPLDCGKSDIPIISPCTKKQKIILGILRPK